MPARNTTPCARPGSLAAAQARAAGQQNYRTTTDKGGLGGKSGWTLKSRDLVGMSRREAAADCHDPHAATDRDRVGRSSELGLRAPRTYAASACSCRRLPRHARRQRTRRARRVPEIRSPPPRPVGQCGGDRAGVAAGVCACVLGGLDCLRRAPSSARAAPLSSAQPRAAIAPPGTRSGPAPGPSSRRPLRARRAPSASSRSSSVSFASSFSVRSRTGANASTTTSASSFLNVP